jgi:RNA polymerase sigma-70 factor (ECF subfamily)
MPSILVDEQSLIRKAQRGDLESFNQLVLAYQSFLFRTAVNILGDEDSAEDATQEALISAFRNLRSFRGQILRSWLTRVLVNACYDQLRHQRRHPTLPLEITDDFDNEMDPAPWLADGARLPQDQVEDRELQRVLQRGLQSLSPHYRAAAVLVDVESLSYEEASQILKVPVGTVKSRVARARLALRTALSRDPGLLAWEVHTPQSRLRADKYA